MNILSKLSAHIEVNRFARSELAKLAFGISRARSAIRFEVRQAQIVARLGATFAEIETQFRA